MRFIRGIFGPEGEDSSEVCTLSFVYRVLLSKSQNQMLVSRTKGPLFFQWLQGLKNIIILDWLIIIKIRAMIVKRLDYWLGAAPSDERA